MAARDDYPRDLILDYAASLGGKVEDYYTAILSHKQDYIRIYPKFQVGSKTNISNGLNGQYQHKPPS
jgi:hypothetical protein